MSPKTWGLTIAVICLIIAVTRLIPAGVKPFLVHPQVMTGVYWLIAAAAVFAVSVALLRDSDSVKYRR